MKFLLLILMSTGITATTFSQEIYQTISGDIAIAITQNDSDLLMISNHLLVLLDYETSKVSFKVGYETFETRIDSIDSQLRAMRGSILEFTGKLGITINTRNFAPQKYNMEGALTSTVPPTPVRGNGSMTCLPTGGGQSPACTLLLSFETTLTALHLNQIFPTAREGVRIDIRQSVLERANDRD